MADFQARCPKCQQAFTYDGSLIGTTGTCPNCGAGFIYPQPAFSDAGEGQQQTSTGPVPPQDPTIPTCANCGAAAPPGSGSSCPFCGASLAGQGVGVGTIPWEERDRIGFFGALFATIKEVLFSPGDFFSRMPITGGLSSPLLFMVIIGTVVGWVGLAFQLLFRGLQFAGGSSKEAALVMGFMALFILAGAFISSGILHVCLMIIGGANRGFEATFRVVCYANAAQVWALIPVCGGLIATVWVLVCEVIGFTRAQNITTGKAVLAVFLPLIAIAVCVAVLMVIGIGFFARGGGFS